SRFLEQVAAFHYGRRRGGRQLAETADRRVTHHRDEIVEARPLVLDAAEQTTARDAVEQLFLTDGAHAARYALPARLVAEERGDAHEHIGHVRALVERNDGADAEPRRVQRLVELVAGENTSRGAADQRGAQVSLPHPAGALHELTDRRAEPDLVRSGLRHVTGDARELRLGGAEYIGAFDEDAQHVHQGLDVVDERRPSEQAHFGREGRAVARLASPSFDRVEQRGLLAADVGAGTAPNLEVEPPARPQHV